MSENDEKYRLLEAQVSQLRSANLELIRQVETLMEIMQEVNPSLSAENVQKIADSQVIAQKMSRGDYQPM